MSHMSKVTQIICIHNKEHWLFFFFSQYMRGAVLICILIHLIVKMILLGKYLVLKLPKFAISQIRKLGANVNCPGGRGRNRV